MVNSLRPSAGSPLANAPGGLSSFTKPVRLIHQSIAWMKRNDKPEEWTDAEVQLLLALSREGVGAVQIASALDRYISSVKRVAENFGLQLRG
jgi:hypothetical protein